MKAPNNTKHAKKAAKKEMQKKVAAPIKSIAEGLKRSNKAKINFSKSSKDKKVVGEKNFKKKANNDKVFGDKSKKYTKTSSKSAPESAEAQKEKRLERKASKPGFKLVEDIKKSWNIVRVKSLPKAERETMITLMAKKIFGNILQVTLRHDASRMVQCIIQFGTDEQRRQILAEMNTKIYEIAKTPYGHFAVLKAITYCTNAAEQSSIINALKGHFVSLGTNVIGARAVESIFQLFPKKITKILKAEFYGHKFVAILPECPSSLRALIEQLPQKLHAVLDHMRDLIQKFVDKGLLEFVYVHHFLWEYIQEITALPVISSGGVQQSNISNATSNNKYMSDLLSVLAEYSLKLMSTKPGTRSICQIIAYSAAKDRKRILKALKGHVLESLLHDSAHLAIMRIVDVTDDTVNVHKMIFEEICQTKAVIKYAANGEIIGESFPPLVSIAKHRFGRKFLLHLLSPQKSFLEPDEVLLFANTQVNTSKKDPVVRRKEHLLFLKESLINVTCRYIYDLVRCPNGSLVVEEVMKQWNPEKLQRALLSVYTNRSLDEDILVIEDSMIGEEEEDGEREGAWENDDEDEQNENLDGDEDGDGDYDEGGDGIPMEVDQLEEEEVNEEELAKIDQLAKEEEEGCKQGHQDAASNASPPKDEVAIYEDVVAQLLLKRILSWQYEIEAKNITAPPDTTVNFAVELAQALEQDDILSNWLKCNRSCFALCDMLKVESCKATLLQYLLPFKKEIKKNAATKGAKCLAEVIKLSK